MKITLEEQLFELVSELGEILEGDLHIIDMSDEYPEYEGEQSFRVYHKQGFCLDVKREANYDVETDDFINWDYYFCSEWNGFDPCTPKLAIEALVFFKMVRSADYG